jgi:Rrf2 family protein
MSGPGVGADFRRQNAVYTLWKTEIVHLSARAQYACIAVLELALQFDSGQPVQIRKIAESHGIPPRFLVQILLQLKAAGIVNSTRGAAGGYRLNREPGELSLGEVMHLVDGTAAQQNGNGAAASPVAQVLQKNWGRVESAKERMLTETSFANLVEQVQKFAAPMYYI